MKRCYSCFKEYDDILNVCPHCGQPAITKPIEPVHLVPGTVLADRYILGLAVGSGGFGVVYKAWDSKLEIIVAVKEFFVSRLVTRAEGLPDLIVSKKSQEEFTYRKERFLAEARDMAKFRDHRSIPNVIEYFEENNTAYIVMELLQGVALNQYMREHPGGIGTDFAIMIANEVGNALNTLHKAKIIHRDVAPDNIYVCSGKELKIKLMDLGAAKLTDATDDVVDIILKPGYSPVEQYEKGADIGPWSDIYALGATLYAMLTGIKPEESTNRMIEDKLLSPREIDPEIPENLSNAVMKAMALDKHMRFRNVKEFLDAINGSRKVIPLNKERKRRKARRALGIVAAIAAVLAIAGLGVYEYTQKIKEQELEPAEISVWFSVEEGSSEENAMAKIRDDFEEKYPDVKIELTAIPAAEYKETLEEALEEGEMPTLFESSGIGGNILDDALPLDSILETPQFQNCLFFEGYSSAYPAHKKIPLAIEVPMAFIITNGPKFIDYDKNYFSGTGDFGPDAVIVYDPAWSEVVSWNVSLEGLSEDTSGFFNKTENTASVMLGSSMEINKVRREVTNFDKKYVYFDAERIECKYIYEWSIGKGEEAEVAAAERLLSWMLGNAYQTSLMITDCNDGQIPVNSICFEEKVKTRMLQPIKEIYTQFVLKASEEN